MAFDKFIGLALAKIKSVADRQTDKHQTNALRDYRCGRGQRKHS